MEDFKNVTQACYTLFRTILGDFNFTVIEQADWIFGPIYFLSYIFFVFFVLLNVFLAIINDTYGEVKADIKTRKPAFQGWKLQSSSCTKKYHKLLFFL